MKRNARPKAEINRIFIKARKDAMAVLRAEVEATMPKGWKLYLAVGWGLTVVNDKHETIFGEYEDPPHRLPKGFRSTLKLAAEFFDMFGAANETLHGKA